MLLDFQQRPTENPQPQYQLGDPFGFSPQPNYTPAPAVPPHPPIDEFAPQAPTYGDISSQVRAFTQN